MDSAGLHDRLTSVPSIISCGPTPNSYISKQLATCCKKKVKTVSEELAGEILCGTDDNFVVRLQQVHEVESSYVENVLH